MVAREIELGDVIEGLVATLEDCRGRFQVASQRLTEAGHRKGASAMLDLSHQCKTFSKRLRAAAARRGLVIEIEGSLAVAFQDDWMTTSDSWSVDVRGVFAAAESGEDRALSTYERALTAELGDFRPIVAAQATKVRRSHHRIQRIRESVQSGL
jgi:hypothetical protein